MSNGYFELEAQSNAPTTLNLPNSNPLDSGWTCLSQSDRRFGLLAGRGWLNNGKPPAAFRRFDAMRVQMLTMYMIKLHRREVEIGKRTDLYTNSYDTQDKNPPPRLMEINDQWLTETLRDLNSYTELLTGFHQVATLDRCNNSETGRFWNTLSGITKYALAFPASTSTPLPDIDIADFLGGPLRDWSLPGGSPTVIERIASSMIRGIHPLHPEQRMARHQNDAWDAGESKVRHRQALARFLLAVIGSIFLLSPIVVLYFVKHSAARMGVLCAFVVSFSGVLSMLNLTPFECLSATAALSAVLIVFVSNNV